MVDLSDKTFSGEERLAQLLALSRGLQAALAGLLEGVRSYHELAEDDLRAVPAAAGYLAASRQMVDRGLQWLEACRTACRTADDFERIDLRPLLEGVVQRCRRVVPPDMELSLGFDEDPAIVEGALFPLQEAFLDALEACVDRAPAQSRSVAVRVDHCQASAADLQGFRARCGPGLYAVVHVRAGPPAPFRFDEWAGFWDGMVRRPEPAPAADVRLLQLYGVVLGHGGDLFFGKTPAGPLLAVALPAEAKRKEMTVEPAPDDAALRGTETILLVDDEDMIWDVIIDMLQGLGYSVILAGNGLEAVEIYRNNPGAIDLVMLDMVMPELDGHGTFLRLKEIDPHVRVLLSSGYVSQEDVRDVLEAGAAGFLQKPYRMADLARRVRAILDASPA